MAIESLERGGVHFEDIIEFETAVGEFDSSYIAVSSINSQTHILDASINACLM